MSLAHNESRIGLLRRSERVDRRRVELCDDKTAIQNILGQGFFYVLVGGTTSLLQIVVL